MSNNFIPAWFPLSASQFAVSQSWGLNTKSNRLSLPTNKHIVEGFSSGSQFLDTELNFIFKSMAQWATYHSQSFHSFDETVGAFFTETEMQYSQSIDHIYQLTHSSSATDLEPKETLGHLVGGAWTTNHQGQLPNDFPNPQVGNNLGPIPFGCIADVGTTSGNRQFNFFTGSFDSVHDYTVHIQALEPDRYFHCPNTQRTSGSFVVAEFRTINDNGVAQVGSNVVTNSGRYDIFVFSLKAVTGSLSIP
jgi:hypothetical protein